MNAGPSGFQNAPVTRTFIIASALLTLIFGVRGRSLRLGLSYQNTIVNLHVWRLIASVFAFSSTPEFIFAVCLLYYFRIFERQIGSNKYSFFILFSLIFSTLFEVLALALLKDSTSTTLASGPYGLIFSSFIPFYFDIPVSSRLRMYGIHLSDKSFVYLAGLQLLLSSWKRSLLPGIAGLIAGFLYHLNAFGIRRIKFPGIVTSLFSRLSWPSRNSSQTSSSRRNASAHLPSHAGRQVERTRPVASVPAAEPPVSSIATLVSMGFDANSARQALIRAGNDINAATNILLEAHSPH